MKHILIAVMALAGIASTAVAQDEAPREILTIWAEGVEAYNNDDYEGFLASMLEIEPRRPYQLPVLYNVASGYALTGQDEVAMQRLEAIAASGLYINVPADNDFDALQRHPRYEALVRNMAMLLQRSGESSLEVEQDWRGVLPEGLAIDTRDGNMYVSTVQSGEIWKVTPDGTWEEFVSDNRHPASAGFFGTTVDWDRNILWATSATPPQYSGPNRASNPPSALFGFDLSSGNVMHYLPLDGEGHLLGEVVIAPNGGIYVTNSGVPRIYRVSDDLGELNMVYGNDEMRSFQGLAFHPNGTAYVADYVHGLFRIDFAGRQVYRLGLESGENLSGIDGLYYYNETLIAVRNGVPPYRIVQHQLSEDGLRITESSILANNHALWDEPTLGQIVGDRLIYNAASGWPDFTPTGEIRENAVLEPIRIMSIELN